MRSTASHFRHRRPRYPGGNKDPSGLGRPVALAFHIGGVESAEGLRKLVFDRAQVNPGSVDPPDSRADDHLRRVDDPRRGLQLQEHDQAADTATAALATHPEGRQPGWMSREHDRHCCANCTEHKIDNRMRIAICSAQIIPA